MLHCDLTLASPAENLALDEALLDACEETGGDEVLRFWEPFQYFVVVGYANAVATEVNVGFCLANGIPILRRCSGGGTVLQGPGCLNYSLIARIAESGPFRSIHSTNQEVMARHCAAINDLLQTSAETEGCNEVLHLVGTFQRTVHAGAQAVSPRQSILASRSETAAVVEMKGQTDLAIGGLKFSGNAQRRKRRFLIFHGSFLLHLDVSLIEKALLMPSREPDYRNGRSHSDFLVNLGIRAQAVKARLIKGWGALQSLAAIPVDRVTALVQAKYGRAEWNLKSR